MQFPSLDRNNSPLSEEQARLFNQFAGSLSPEQASWISGYLAGVRAVAHGSGGGVHAVSAPVHGPELTILVGSQTGNSDKVAEEAKARALAKGLKATVKSMGDYKLPQLKNEKNVLVVISTQGEGDPPDNAKEFYEFLHGKRAPKLEQAKFSVLGLGDSSYTYFCKMGIDFDRRLEELGATRIYPRVDCDVDYEEAASSWMEGALGEFVQALGATSSVSASVVTAPSGFASTEGVYSKRNPFPAEVLENLVLNGRGSSKETRHIELSLENSGLTYEPGDAVGVFPVNCPEVVDRLIGAVGLGAGDMVTVGDAQMPLREALLTRYEVTTLTRPMMQKYAALVGSKKLAGILKEDALPSFIEYVNGREIIDLVEDYPGKGMTAIEFAQTLRKLPPRLYSIASSLAAHPEEVHLTVVAVRYQSHGRDRKGVCSTYFADRLGEDARVPVFIEHNKNFKLPADSTAPIMMVGPGTGVAPFRAFLEDREAAGATGRNWLFFGDQHFETDFMYQVEWQNYLKRGLLTRIDLAFSRDQKEKVYVQHRMLEQQKDVYAWLEEGASFYVCGDEKRMAHDVHAALLEIVRVQGGKTAEQAEEYVKALQREKRYQRDVY
ncbi:MAG TPA: assimilatory sulfite reductase (NADPH) flavoprotein subunit [Kiritimatiellia bacterium]|nr:assimilatory sulfite reductase (NADPH) flavoprotein subunit [Kiritimatiellia bacterium]